MCLMLWRCEKCDETAGHDILPNLKREKKENVCWTAEGLMLNAIFKEHVHSVACSRERRLFSYRFTEVHVPQTRAGTDKTMLFIFHIKVMRVMC